MLNALPREPLCVNRIAEIEMMRHARASDGALLAAVSGTHGIGKTTLLLAAGHALKGEFAGGVVYVEAGAASAGDVARQVLVNLGMDPERVPAADDVRIVMARDMIARSEALILIDDVDSADRVRPLLGAMPGAGMVVSSEHPLPSLEQRWGFTPVPLGGFSNDDGVTLLSAVAGADLGLELCADAHKLCGGVPLTLTAVGLLLRESDDPADTVALLRRDARALTDLVIDSEPVVQAALDRLYDRLGDRDDKRAYRVLTLLPAVDFGITAAAGILGVDEATARRTLRRLVNGYLLRNKGAGRYDYHFFARQHASVQEGENLAERDALVRDAVRRYQGRVVALDSALSRRPVISAMARPAYRDAVDVPADIAAAASEFEREWLNFVAAARIAAELGDPRMAVTFAVALCGYGYRAARAGDALDICCRALDVSAEPSTTWQLHRDMAQLNEKLGDLVTMEHHIERAHAAGYPPGTASLLEWDGLRLEGMGERTRAVARLSEALDAVSLMDDPFQEPRARALLQMHIARNRYALQQNTEATAYAESAHEYFAAHAADAHNAALCLVLLGDIVLSTGDTEKARSRWTAALPILESLHLFPEADAVRARLSR